MKILLLYSQIQSLSILHQPLFEDSDIIIRDQLYIADFINNSLDINFKEKNTTFVENLAIFAPEKNGLLTINDKIRILKTPMKHNLSSVQEKIIDSVLQDYGALSIQDLHYTFTIDKYLLLKINKTEDNKDLITLSPNEIQRRLDMTIQDIATI